ncbi:MAG: glycosyltransferase family 2 protein [Gammaproteobacteria bacterium]|nr:glycosyltransferase family 2 protein [Gammaproteobacteria bacterium]
MQRNINPNDIPIISCLMVTQHGRLSETQQAIKCFIYQDINPIELVIVHDSGSSYHKKLLSLIEGYQGACIHIYQKSAGHTLGWLRNRSIEHARATLICQWDDDDYNHPDRLKTQYNLMQEEDTEFCFMTDQLHLFTEQGFLFWDDRSYRQPPYDLIENTMLGRKNLIGVYPELDRGEDTAIIEHISKQHFKISRLSAMGWLYTYVFNGKNTWDFKHHSEISLHQRLTTAKLFAQKKVLETELKRYAFPFDHLHMPHEKGKLEFIF